jgi:hypothetical protein
MLGAACGKGAAHAVSDSSFVIDGATVGQACPTALVG